MELLDAREERVRNQKKLLKEFSSPLICFTMNIAGPVKISRGIKRAFDYGVAELDRMLYGQILFKKTEYLKSGPVAYFSVNSSASFIKKVCINIEDSCPLGRLFDMDVIDVQGNKLERPFQRRCIICNKEGRSCAAGRLHSVMELQKVTKNIIENHFVEADCLYFSKLCKVSLIDEVYTTPKPGLVDSLNSGSHTDMNVDTFIKSANALQTYFKECVKTGIETKKESPDHTFQILRKLGLLAEKEMYLATDGVNTHKGIIYSLGIISGAIGRLWTLENPFPDTETLLRESSLMVKESVRKDFTNINPSTAGGRLYLSNGEMGVRGEASLGFPTVANIALPVYKKAVMNGKNKNDAGIEALLHLIASIYDSALYNRGGEKGVEYAQKYASELLSHEYITTEDIVLMDKAFIERNLSPGGSADLLAIMYFLSELESKRTSYNSYNKE